MYNHVDQTSNPSLTNTVGGAQETHATVLQYITSTHPLSLNPVLCHVKPRVNSVFLGVTETSSPAHGAKHFMMRSFVSFRHLMAQQIFGPDYTSDKQGTSGGIAGTF